MVFKGARSYLKREKAHTVLCGILDVKCEVYFKDLIIRGNPTTNFVIAWMKSWPCSRSWSCIQQVKIFPTKRSSQISSSANIKKRQRFLGLVNYFGDHGRDLATLTHRYEHSTRRRKKKENFNRKTILNTVLIGSRKCVRLWYWRLRLSRATR